MSGINVVLDVLKYAIGTFLVMSFVSFLKLISSVYSYFNSILDLSLWFFIKTDIILLFIFLVTTVVLFIIFLYLYDKQNR